MTSVIASLSRMTSVRESQTSTLFAVTVTKDKFYVRLKTSKERYPVVSGFDKDMDGLPGEVEASGRVQDGDFLKSVNGISLFNMPFKQCVSIIRQESKQEGAKELTFFRFEKPPEEECTWQTKSPVYSTYSREVLSALRDRGDLDINTARAFSKLGLPDDGGVRSVLWKVLLGFLPPEASRWDDCLARSRASYQDLQAELIVDPRAREDPQPRPPPLPLPQHIKGQCRDESPPCEDLSLPPGPSQRRIALSAPLFGPAPSPSAERALLAALLDTHEAAAAHTLPPQQSQSQRMRAVPVCCVRDDPLSQAAGSAWRGYWDDLLLYESIEKDVMRTYPSLHFYAEESGVHHASLQRILYLYAKLNPGIKYVQGMNELVGTLFYVFGNQMSYEPWRPHAEADTFFCFSLLMIDVRDLFIRNLDDASCGIGGRIQAFVDMLQALDPEVAARLHEQGVAPSFYSLRWITTLFTREFDLLDTIRLWDSLFADTDRHDLLCCLCCTMVTEQREELLTGDFISNLTLLQHYPPVHISYFLSRVEHVRAQDRRGARRGTSAEWGGNSGSALDSACGDKGPASTSAAQPLVSQLLSSLQDRQWLAGVRHSLLGDARSRASAHALVPDFRICRDSSPQSFASGGGGERGARSEAKVVGAVISFDEVTSSVSREPGGSREEAVGSEEDQDSLFEPMWDFGSPLE